MLCLLIFLALSLYLNNRSRVLEEVIFFKNDKIELKMVKAYENFLFHYVGNTFRLQCRSKRTANMKETKFGQSGWNNNVPMSMDLLSAFQNLKSGQEIQSLKEFALDSFYYGKETLVIPFYDKLFISWDLCYSFERINLDEVVLSRLNINLQSFMIQDILSNQLGALSFSLLENEKKIKIYFSTIDFGKNWTIHQ